MIFHNFNMNLLQYSKYPIKNLSIKYQKFWDISRMDGVFIYPLMMVGSHEWFIRLADGYIAVAILS